MKKLLLIGVLLVAHTAQGAVIGALIGQSVLQGGNLHLDRWELIKSLGKKTFVGECVRNEQTQTSSFNEPYCGTRFRRILATGSLCWLFNGIAQTVCGAARGSDMLLKSGPLITGVGFTGVAASLCLDEMRDCELLKSFNSSNVAPLANVYPPANWGYVNKYIHKLFVGSMPHQTYLPKEPLIHPKISCGVGSLFLYLMAHQMAFSSASLLFKQGLLQSQQAEYLYSRSFLVFCALGGLTAGYGIQKIMDKTSVFAHHVATVCADEGVEE